MSASKRRQIIEAVKARQETTNEVVFLNEASGFGPDDPRTAIVIVIGDDIVRQHGEHTYITLPLSIQAVVAADLDAPWIASEDILALCKTAMELDDRTLGGLVAGDGLSRGTTRTLKREEGSPFVGVAVDYFAAYTELWGHP